MVELNRDQLEATLSTALPEDLRERADELATAILHLLAHPAPDIARPELLAVVQTLAGESLNVAGKVLNFGSGNQIGDIRIRDVAGRDIVTHLTLNLGLAQQAWDIATTDVLACPYPGLAVFGAADASYFFGREADITRLLQHIDRPIIAVTGPSGVGKSSFVLAGIVPRLRAQTPDLTPVIFQISTSAELLNDLALTLEVTSGQPADVIRTALSSNDNALGELLLGLNATGRVVCVLDQFEELFVGTDKTRQEDRDRLLDLLVALEQQANPRLLVILTSRENYFEHPDYLARPDLRPIIQQRNVVLAGLSDAQLREAILKPLEAFNARPERQDQPPVAFEPGVIDLFEQEFRRTERTLPLVQYLLRLLWTEQRALSKSAYTTLGGLERALDRHASKIYEAFTVEDQQLVRAVLLALVRPGIDNEYTRRRVPRDELIGSGPLHHRIAAVIGRLASQDSRIISEQQVGQLTYVEFTHEILLRQWERLRLLIDTYRQRLEQREQLLPVAEQWHQSLLRTGKGDRTYLYRGSQLRQAKAYLTTTDLPQGLDTGIQTCYTASVQQQRWQIITATVVTLVTVLVLMVGFNWFRDQLAAEEAVSSQRATAQVLAEQTAQAEAVQRATAEAGQEYQQNIAIVRQLIAQAEQLSRQTNTPNSLSVLLSVEAARRALELNTYSLENDQALRRAIDNEPAPKHSITTIDEHSITTFSLVENVVAVSNGDNTILHIFGFPENDKILEGEFHEFSIDGRVVVTKKDNRMLFWDVNSGEKIAEHESVLALELSIPIVAVNRDGLIEIIRVTDNQKIQTIPVDYPVENALFSPNGNLLILAGGGGLQIWNVQDGFQLEVLAYKDSIRYIRFTSDSQKILVTSGSALNPNDPMASAFTDDSHAYLWSIIDKKEILEISDVKLRFVSFSPDEKYLTIGRGEGFAFGLGPDQGSNHLDVFDISTGDSVFSYDSLLLDMRISPDDRLIAIRGYYTGVEIFEIESNQIVSQIPVASEVAITGSISFSNDGNSLVSNAYDSRIGSGVVVWNIAQNRLVFERKYPYYVPDANVTSDGFIVIAAEETEIWDLNTNTESLRLNGHPTISPSGKILSIANPQLVTLHVIEARGLVQGMKLPTPIEEISFSSNGQIVAVVSRGKISIWSTVTSSEILSQDGNCVALHPNGKIAAVCRKDSSLSLYDFSGVPTEIALFSGEQSALTLFSHNGTYLATANSSEIKVISVNESAVYKTWILPSQPKIISFDKSESYIAVAYDKFAILYSLEEDVSIDIPLMSSDDIDYDVVAISQMKFSDDGRFLALAGGHPFIFASGKLVVWDVVNSRAVLTGQDNQLDAVINIDFRSKNNELAFVTINIPNQVASTVYRGEIWDVATNTKKLQIDNDTDREDESEKISNLVFSPDGNYLAIIQENNTVRITETNEWDNIKDVSRIIRSRKIQNLMFTQDGNRIIVVEDDGSISMQIWRPEDLINEACQRVTRNLTIEEWQKYLSIFSYRKTCLNVP